MMMCEKAMMMQDLYSSLTWRRCSNRVDDDENFEFMRNVLLFTLIHHRSSSLYGVRERMGICEVEG